MVRVKIVGLWKCWVLRVMLVFLVLFFLLFVEVGVFIVLLFS